MDGYVVIGTRLDTKQLETDLKNAKKELTGFQKEEEKLLKEKGKAELNLVPYEEEKAKIKANTNEMKQQATTKEQVRNLTALERQELDNLNIKYNKQINAIDAVERKLEKNKVNQGLINNKVQEINKNLEKSKGFDKVKSSIKDVNKGLTDTVKKVGRWALAIFSVRSAYNLIRQASTTLARYNEQYANNLEYLRYVLAQTLAPALEYLVNLAYKLLSYVNYIANAWFGVNLFSRASAKNFNKMAGSAEKIKKSLQTAGFDEMNILSDTSSGASAGGVATPNMDLSAMEGEVPEWIKWIAEHKDEILSVMAGVAVGLTAWNLGLSGIKSLGIGVMIIGIISTIKTLLKYIQSPSWENFGKVIQSIGLAIIGLGILIGGVPTIIAGAILLIIGTITKHWEQIKGFFQNGIDWLKQQSEFVHEMFGNTIGNVYDLFVNGLQEILNLFDNVFNMLKGIFDGLIQFIRGVFTGDWEMAWNGIWNIFASVWNGIAGLFNSVMRLIRNMVVNVAQRTGNVISGVFKAVVNNVMWTIERVLNSPIRAVNRLIGVINNVPGIDLGYLPTFNLPRLKTGGIINMPGRGIPVGSAIAGEAGAEGVIPLTDSQAMETLGEAIGKYITINATILNRMDSRVISRQLQQIKNANDFAYNS